MDAFPTIEFCGLRVTRLIIGANPFGGFSHQNRERDREMRGFHTEAEIVETWRQAEAGGLNTMITNNESPNVMAALRRYRENGGQMQWIAQVANHREADMFKALDEVAEVGCAALYFHGGLTDKLFRERDADTLRAWCEHARGLGIPIGTAGHIPDNHRWVRALELTDFHAVCCFNCGSVHAGEGERFLLADMFAAYRVIQELDRPCIVYKIMGAGRIDPPMAFEHAFATIKSNDVVNVGMHRGDKPDMVPENIRIARSILTR